MAKKTTAYGPDSQDMASAFKKGMNVSQIGMPGMAAVKAGNAVGNAIYNSASKGVRGIKGMFSSADATPAPKAAPNLGGMSGRGSAKAAPSYGKATVASTGATTGSISKPDAASAAASKKRGDAYLANNTDYGVGSAVNSFVNKKKR